MRTCRCSIALAEAFAGAGFTVLRCDLPFRQVRSFGPPRPGDAARDREGLKNAVAEMKKLVPGGCFSADRVTVDVRPACCSRMRKLPTDCFFFPIPLHAPAKPDQPRIQHLPKLNVPTLFVHGTKDPFGTIEEIENAGS